MKTRKTIKAKFFSESISCTSVPSLGSVNLGEIYLPLL